MNDLNTTTHGPALDVTIKDVHDAVRELGRAVDSLVRDDSSAFPCGGGCGGCGGCRGCRGCRGCGSCGGCR